MYFVFYSARFWTFAGVISGVSALSGCFSGAWIASKLAPTGEDLY